MNFLKFNNALHIGIKLLDKICKFKRKKHQHQVNLIVNYLL